MQVKTKIKNACGVIITDVWILRKKKTEKENTIHKYILKKKILDMKMLSILNKKCLNNAPTWYWTCGLISTINYKTKMFEV